MRTIHRKGVEMSYQPTAQATVLTRVTMGVTLMLTCGFTPNGLMAQRILIQVGGGLNREAEMYDQFMGLLDDQKSAAQHRMDSHVADIDLACDLTDAQRTTLTIAGKGATKAHVAKATELIKKSAKQMGFDFVPDNPPKQVEADDEEIPVVRGGRLINLFNGANGENDNLVEQEKVWIHTVEKTLSDQQIQTLAIWSQARNDAIQKSAVDHFVSKADLRLFLSPDQRDRLTKWVDKKYGEQLVAQLESPQPQQQQFIILNRARNARIDHISQPVEEILSEAQQEIWKQSIQKELDQIEQLNRRLPVFRMQPAKAKK